MEVKAIRFAQKSEATTGLFFIDGDFKCFTLEDMFREVKITGETRIPAGKYPLSLAKWGDLHSRYLSKFGSDFHKGMIMLNDVPGFTGILIHMGANKEHTRGCLLVGTVSNPETGTLTSSEDAYRRIYTPIANELIAGNPVSITVYDGNVLRSIK